MNAKHHPFATDELPIFDENNKLRGFLRLSSTTSRQTLSVHFRRPTDLMEKTFCNVMFVNGKFAFSIEDAEKTVNDPREI